MSPWALDSLSKCHILEEREEEDKGRNFTVFG
jgi:hypothetical protein